MSFNYSNPFSASSSTKQSAPSGLADPITRSTFGAAMASKGYQLFFSGLPTDIGNKDLMSLLESENISLNTSSVQYFHSPDNVPLGMALIVVSNEDDAERLRRRFSGRLIDDTWRLTVQHMLAPTQSFPSASIPAYPMQPPAPAAPAAPKAKQESGPKGKTQAATKGSDKPPGLSLLKRIGKPGEASQSALLAKQRANLKNKSPGNALSSRISGPKVPTLASTKAKNARTISGGGGGGATKVGRAKAAANKDAMDVDKPASKAKAAVPKAPRPERVTQQKLDEEMRAWDRERRFAAQ
ncbi:hypothetical protein BD324DRAFT_652503 [Kockovaella imperatae]|uniref:RRM domain-containing protein n=1 Tax=Kockovaella imperatae TaxID=4999 RepID=A0A1Y1UBE9_9TREE|nr:hypothetical protein BD324DRAFT_652503 [Kockovaella imperatae]ORX35370.1 hypothetical protein BD324DRAFT_652503 [Kockovaella imperatae]